MPVTRDVYVDPLLTQLSVAYKNDDFVADRVFPTLYVDKRSGLYFEYDKQNLRKENTNRTGMSATPEADFGMSQKPYGPLQEHDLKVGIPKDVLEQYDSPLEPRQDATNVATEKLLIEKEVNLANALNDNTKVTQFITLAGSSQWSDYSNSTPFTDIETGMLQVKRQGLKRPNKIIFSEYVWGWLKNHPDFLDRIKYAQVATLTPQMLATLIGIDEVIIGGAVQNTANEGAADALDFIWGKHAWLMYVTPTPQLRTMTAGYTLTLRNGRYVDRWVDTDRKGEYVRANDYYEQKFVAAPAIYQFKNATI